MMKSPVIADSSGFVSLVSATDSNHVRALAGSVSIQEQHLPFIMPGEIITETVNVLGKKVSHDIAVRVGKSILESSDFTIVETSTNIRKEALVKFSSQPASVSFTDCLVMAMADAYNT